MLEMVHHVAYVVDDMDKAIAFFSQKFDVVVERRWVSPEAGTEFCTCIINDFVFEFLAPAGPDSRHHKTLAARGGPCLDHVAYGVHKIDEVLVTLKGRGVLPLGEAPRIAPTGWRVANMDPATTMGIPMQLVDIDYKG
jgi:catechol 2,3-dioxygenase-like lactoylglutathione lyase family enzyme